jgi:hypothetical protein
MTIVRQLTALVAIATAFSAPMTTQEQERPIIASCASSSPIAGRPFAGQVRASCVRMTRLAPA